MEDQIPQSFKVQWLNTTLKFLKNDKELRMEYPEMPVKHMEYLHNLIWQRKNDVGLGFKSLYAPVWEAMKIFSLKYRFKVFVNVSPDGEKGYLAIEKILKESRLENQEPVLDTCKYEPSDESEDTKSESESSGSSSGCPNIQCKVKKRLTKSERYFVDKRKIIDSISPTFLKKTLQTIFDFLNNEMEASVVFSDLAPIESTFLENFLGIYKRRKGFKTIFTPSCNDLMKKIYNSFKDFEENYKMEIGAAKYDYKTEKREVVFIKVPRYKSKQSSVPKERQAKKHNTISNILTPANKINNTEHMLVEKITKSSNISSAIEVVCKIGLTNNITNESEAKSKENDVEPIAIIVKAIQEIDKVNIDDKILKNGISNDDGLINIEKVAPTSMSPEIFNGNRVKTDKKMDISDKENKNVDKEADPSFLRDSIQRSFTPSSIENFTTNNTQTSKSLVSYKLPTKTSITKVKGIGLRKARLLEAMSTPLESQKAMRMMHLMGWNGGALGVRGEGLIEPIIPALHYTVGAGLGHMKKEPEVKKQTVKQASKSKHRIDFLDAVKDLVERNTTVSVVRYKQELLKKDKKCLRNIVRALNKRLYLEMTPNENVILREIDELIYCRPELALSMYISSDSREVTLTKTIDNTLIVKLTKKDEDQEEEEEATSNNTADYTNRTIYKKIQKALLNDRPLSTNQFKAYVCIKVYEFLKGTAVEEAVALHQTMVQQNLDYVAKICACVNHGQKIPSDVPRQVVSCMHACMDSTGNTFLDVQISKNKRSFVLLKLDKAQYLSGAILTTKNENVLTVTDSYKLTDENKATTSKDNIYVPRSSIKVETDTNIKNKQEKHSEGKIDNIKNDIYEDKVNDLNGVIIDSTQDEINKEETIKDIYIPKNNLYNENNNDICMHTNSTDTDDEEDLQKIDNELIKRTICNLTSSSKNGECDLNISGKDSQEMYNEDESKSTCKVCFNNQTLNGRQWYKRGNDFLEPDNFTDTKNPNPNRCICNDNQFKEREIDKTKYKDKELFSCSVKNFDPNNNDKSQVNSVEDTKVLVNEITSLDSITCTNRQNITDNNEHNKTVDFTGACKDRKIPRKQPCESVQKNIDLNNKSRDKRLSEEYANEDNVEVEYMIILSENVSILNNTKNLSVEEEFNNHNKEKLKTLINDNNTTKLTQSNIYKLINDNAADKSNFEIQNIEVHTKNDNNKEDLRTQTVKENIDKELVNPDGISNYNIAVKDESSDKTNDDLTNQCSQLNGCNNVIYEKPSTPMIEENKEKSIEENHLISSAKGAPEKIICDNKLYTNDKSYEELLNSNVEITTAPIVTNEIKLTALNAKEKTIKCIEDKDKTLIKSKSELLLSSIENNIAQKNNEISTVNGKLDHDPGELMNIDENINDGRCYDIVIIKSDTNKSSLVLQALIEKELETAKEFIPLLKFHDTVDSGIIYSCHSKDTRTWLENKFGDRIVDYKRRIKYHKIRISVANFTHDKMKILKFLENYNSGFKTSRWISYSLYGGGSENCFTFVVGMDDESFQYVCDHNFSLWAGFDRAHFSITY